MARAERAGARVRATFKEAIGPKSQVTGASTTPTARTLVLAGRFTPPGNPTAVE